MKIAIPLAEGKLCTHFGHCENFALIEVDKEGKSVVSNETVQTPEHQPGLLPRWLAERGVNLVIAGGMGMRAQRFFREFGIDVLVGAPSEPPKKIVNDWLGGTIETGVNVCDH